MRALTMALALAAWTLAGMGMSAQANAQEAGIKIGILTCKAIPGTQRTLIIHSSVGLDCTFETPDGSEKYQGESGIALGLDLSWNRKETIHYAVLSGTTAYEIGSHGLAGKFVGGKASATIGVGLGAAALIGGGENNITLQPLAIETSTGLGVSGGIGYLFLVAGK